jgi:alpha-L-fucosidase
MYVQGSDQYDYHVKTYGHPSQFGYKDICNIWKAERWNPEELISLYARSGAKYFVALANHHGNFDCWNSKYQPWNCVNVGPKRDIVGTWEKVARAHGLRFGITFHGTPGRVWKEFMPVRYDSDETGPFKGVPYDGVLTKGDGKGKWWDGMDPQRFNGYPHEKDDPAPNSWTISCCASRISSINTIRTSFISTITATGTSTPGLHPAENSKYGSGCRS